MAGSSCTQNGRCVLLLRNSHFIKIASTSGMCDDDDGRESESTPTHNEKNKANETMECAMTVWHPHLRMCLCVMKNNYQRRHKHHSPNARNVIFYFSQFKYYATYIIHKRVRELDSSKALKFQESLKLHKSIDRTVDSLMWVDSTEEFRFPFRLLFKISNAGNASPPCLRDGIIIIHVRFNLLYSASDNNNNAVHKTCLCST